METTQFDALAFYQRTADRLNHRVLNSSGVTFADIIRNDLAQGELVEIKIGATN